MLDAKDGVLWLGHAAFIPSIHGRVAFAREARRVFLANRFATVAVELPESFAERTIEGVGRLPIISAVSYAESDDTRCFFPMDPCDSIVEAVRLGLAENCRLEFIDCDVESFERRELVLPDSYAVNTIGLARYYEAVKSSIGRPPAGSQDDVRERYMASRIFDILQAGARRLPVLCVIGLAHLEGVASYLEQVLREGKEALGELPAKEPPPFVELHDIGAESLYHILGELPYTTYQYERERGSVTLDEFEAVDKVKELLLEARDRYHSRHPADHERISLASFQNLLQLVRNHCLLQKRLTPMLYEMVVAAKGIGGSELAIDVITTAKEYPPLNQTPPEPDLEMAPEGFQTSDDDATGDEEPGSLADMTEEAMSAEGETFRVKKRYIDEAKVWKKVKLEPPPPPKAVQRWKKAWDPRASCSWTPEDVLIENFAGHVRSRALLESGLAQEHLEEFTTSFKDGIHIRETIRNLHLGKIIVKETSQPRGQVDAVVILYERPDPKRFPWRITWFPEFVWESVLALYATDYRKDLVGPGIARAEYGGQLFVRPTAPIEDVWTDESLDEARDDAERLVFAGVKHSSEVYVAYVAPFSPTARMKAFASRHRKKIIYLPLSSFSRTTIQRLRRFHVLNGKPVRGWAHLYIR